MTRGPLPPLSVAEAYNRGKEPQFREWVPGTLHLRIRGTSKEQRHSVSFGRKLNLEREAHRQTVNAKRKAGHPKVTGQSC